MLTELLKSHIGPVLSNAGFRKRGTTWNRSVDEFVHVLDLQKGRNLVDGGVDFTLNVGLWFKSVWCTCWGKTPPDFVGEEDCFPRFRIGFLLDEFDPRFRDRWWLLTDERSIEKVGGELCEIIEDKCLAFFADHTSSRKVVEFAEQKLPIRLPLERLYLAIFQFVVGKVETSQHTFSELEADPYWGQRTREAWSRLHHNT